MIEESNELPGAADDAAVEQQIQTKGLSAPRITPDQIDAMMHRVLFAGGQVPGTTTTIMHAFLDSVFYLGTAHSACVSPENFDEELGVQIAQRKLQALVRDKLWELEGFRLYCELNQTQPA